MDVSSPLRSLVHSLDSAVLEVLAETEAALGATKRVHLAGRGSRTGAQKVLDRLTEHGIVLAEPTNHGHIYRLNRDHAVVFGSPARTDGTPHSDIDLFLLMPAGFNPNDEWETQMRRLKDRVLAWSGNRLEVLANDRDGLRKMIRNSEALLDRLYADATPLISDLRKELADQVRPPRSDLGVPPHPGAAACEPQTPHPPRRQGLGARPARRSREVRRGGRTHRLRGRCHQRVCGIGHPGRYRSR
jgi:predicted nucleotidyltransferase